jgi:hypothetical protein
MHKFIDGPMDRFIDLQIYRWRNKHMDRWKDGQIYRWTDGQRERLWVIKKKETIIGYLKVKLQKFKRFFNFLPKCFLQKNQSNCS